MKYGQNWISLGVELAKKKLAIITLWGASLIALVFGSQVFTPTDKTGWCKSMRAVIVTKSALWAFPENAKSVLPTPIFFSLVPDPPPEVIDFKEYQRSPSSYRPQFYPGTFLFSSADEPIELPHAAPGTRIKVGKDDLTNSTPSLKCAQGFWQYETVTESRL